MNGKKSGCTRSRRASICSNICSTKPPAGTDGIRTGKWRKRSKHAGLHLCRLQRNQQANRSGRPDLLQSDPVAFIELCWPKPSFGEAGGVAQAVANHKRVTVRSGHGVGKSWLMARFGYFHCIQAVEFVTIRSAWTQVEKCQLGEIAFGISFVLNPAELFNTQWKIADGVLRWHIDVSVDQRVRFQVPFPRSFGDSRRSHQACHRDNGQVRLRLPQVRIVAIGNPSSPSRSIL